MSIQPSSSRAFAIPDVTNASVGERVLQSNTSLLVSPRLAREELLLPRGIGGVFDLAFDLYRAHFHTLFTIVAVALLPLQAVLYLLLNTWLKPLNAYLDTHPDDITAAFGFITGAAMTGYPAYGVPGLFSLIALAIVSAPVAIALSDLYRGQTPVWTDCYRRAFRHIPRVLLGWLVMLCVFVAVVILALTIATLLASVVALAVGGTLPTAISVILGVIFVLTPYVAGMTMLAFGFVFTTPLIVLEDLPITAIPARNWQLVKRPRARRTLAAVLFLPIVFFTLQLLMLLSLTGLLELVSLPATMAFLLETTISVLLIAFLQPYLLIFAHVLYFDYRIQRDGLDIRLLAETLPFVTSPNVFASPAPSQPAAAPTFPAQAIPVPQTSPSPIATLPDTFPPMDFSSPPSAPAPPLMDFVMPPAASEASPTELNTPEDSR